jgi:glycosyltransferase involved in cell wall biosynthesis
MKIALVVPGGVDRSETERVIPVILALIRRLARTHEVHVFALHQEPARGEWTIGGARIHNVGAGRTRRRAILAIRREHRRASFAVVHAVWSGSIGLVAVLAARLIGVPSLVHVAGGELAAFPDIGYGGRLNFKGRVCEALVLRAANVVTAASAPMIAALARLGIPAHRVPLGVDLENWPVRAPAARAPGSPARLVHVASLNRVKDQTTLLRAIATLTRSGKALQLAVVGEDTLGGAMQALACELGLEPQVRFYGFLPQARLRPVIEAADLLVMSSRHEAGPIVVLEAALAGVPTVGTAVGHIAEFAPDAALAVGVGDAAALAAGIAALLDDEPRRLRLAQAAQARARTEDAADTVQRFQALYREARQARGGTAADA